MAGGKGKIHEHPNANTKGFHKIPENINKTGTNRKSFSAFNLACKKIGVEELTEKQYIKSLSFLFSLTEEEIKKIASDKDQPLALRLMIAELTDPQTRGKTLQDFREYLFKKGVLKVEVTEIKPPIEWVKNE
jgi:hypothetical protein